MSSTFAAARSGLQGIGTWLKGGNKEKKLNIETEPDIIQDGKQKFGWYDVSATAATEDILIVGFGNGALLTIDTKNNVKKDSLESIKYANWNFTSDNQPVDKL